LIHALNQASPADRARLQEIAQNLEPETVPELRQLLFLYTEDEAIFKSFGIEREIDKALRSKVWLKSGGYLVIEQTVEVEPWTEYGQEWGSTISKRPSSRPTGGGRRDRPQARLRDLGYHHPRFHRHGPPGTGTKDGGPQGGAEGRPVPLPMSPLGSACGDDRSGSGRG
jgi:hypothetical protein